MKNLTKAQLIDREALVGAIRSKQEIVDEMAGKVEDAIRAANELIDQLNEAIVDMNGSIEDASSWVSEIASDIQGYIDDRSDKWRESENGERYQSWLSNIEGLSIEQASEIDQIPDIENVIAGYEAIALLEDEMATEVDAF